MSERTAICVDLGTVFRNRLSKNTKLFHTKLQERTIPVTPKDRPRFHLRLDTCLCVCINLKFSPFEVMLPIIKLTREQNPNLL